jgi:hypothetical protein
MASYANSPRFQEVMSAYQSAGSNPMPTLGYPSNSFLPTSFSQPSSLPPSMNSMPYSNRSDYSPTSPAPPTFSYSPPFVSGLPSFGSSPQQGAVFPPPSATTTEAPSPALYDYSITPNYYPNPYGPSPSPSRFPTSDQGSSSGWNPYSYK